MAFSYRHESQIERLASQVVFFYAYDSLAQQYAHPAVITFYTTGLIARYIYGIQYDARDIKFSLIDVPGKSVQ